MKGRRTLRHLTSADVLAIAKREGIWLCGTWTRRLRRHSLGEAYRRADDEGKLDALWFAWMYAEELGLDGDAIFPWQGPSIWWYEKATEAARAEALRSAFGLLRGVK